MFENGTLPLKTQRIIVFTLGFLLYTCLHACRSTWAYVSGEIADNGSIPGFDSKFLGYVNFTFLMSLGLSLLIFGQIGDKMNVKYFTLFGTFGLGTLFIIMGIVYESGHASKAFFLCMMCIAGIFSSSPWPGLLSIMNNWFPKEGKVILMGFFAASINAGNILGFTVSGLTYEVIGLSLVVPVYICGTLQLLMSIICAFYLKPEPEQIVIEIETKSQINSNQIADTNPQVEQLSNIEELPQLSIWKAWAVPGVAIYAVAFGCIKAVFQVLGFWLPNYLDNLNISHVAFINIMIDLGAMIGGITMCYCGVYFNKRATLIVPSLWIGTIFMIAINFLKNYTDPVVGYMILSLFTGFFIGGCYNNISSAIAVELSNKRSLKKYKHASSTIISIVMGYGTTFVSINMLLIPIVKEQLFLYCGAQAMTGGLLLIPVIIHEWQPTKQDIEISKEVEMQ